MYCSEKSLDPTVPVRPSRSPPPPLEPLESSEPPQADIRTIELSDSISIIFFFMAFLR